MIVIVTDNEYEKLENQINQIVQESRDIIVVATDNEYEKLVDQISMDYAGVQKTDRRPVQEVTQPESQSKTSDELENA